jgi:serine/threonine protein kinase/WD40 repeat protein
VVRLLEGYLEQLEQGALPRPEEWLAEHPDLSGRLGECLATLELLHQTARSVGRESRPGTVPAPKELALGQLGDYRLVREVGRGGMGIVYEAVQIPLGRRVALKVLPLAGALDARQLQRFHNEARTASQLHHAHIVDVFGAGCEGGVHHYAMRYIQGQTLAQLIERMRNLSGLEPAGAPAGEAERLPAAPPETELPGPFLTADSAWSPGYCRAAAAVVAQVAEALDYAHERGVVHRDIKPSNVMLDSEGRAWVTDFGLAHLQRQAHLTQSGDLLGTLRYMSPEQAGARRDVLDHRTDIYALGATLYELLTLQPAVPGTEREEILRWLTWEEAVWPSRLNPAIPPDLEAIVLKAMAKAPGERYGTAQELADDLRRFVNDQPVQARRPTRLQQAGKWARRHCWPLLVTAGAAVLTLTLAVALLALSNVHFREALARSELQAQEQRARAAEREVTLQLAQARWNEARNTRQARQPGQRYHSLEALAEAVRHLRSLDQLEAHRLGLRNDALACLTLWDVRPVRQLSRVSSNFPDPCFDPLGQHYACADGPNLVSWRRQADDQVVHRWQWQGLPCTSLAVSPDGRYVAAFCLHNREHEKQVCRVWDSVTGSPVLQRPISNWDYDFGTDGKLLALVQANGSITLSNLGTGRDLPPLPARAKPRNPRFHPSGQYLAVTTDGPEVEVWNLATAKVVFRLAGDSYHRGSLGWSPDGSFLAVGSGDNNIYVCRFPEGKNPRTVLRGHEGVVTRVEYHPSGQVLASASHDDTTRLWFFPTGGELVLPGEQFGRFSRDGRRLLTWSRRRTGVTEWEVAAPGITLHSLPDSQGPNRPDAMAFAPDSRLLAFTRQDGVHLWDAAAGRLVGRVPSGDGCALAFHPQGQCLFTTGNGGLMQWPIVAERDAPALRVGPGTVVRPTSAPSQSLRIDVAGKGDWLLLGAGDGGLDLVPLVKQRGACHLGTPEGAEGFYGVALSPDCHWAVWATHIGDPVTGEDVVRIWDVAQGTVVRSFHFPAGQQPGAAFSPDGRWLVTGVRSEYCFREVGSWEAKARLPREPRSIYCYVAFSGDGRLLALGQGFNRIELREAGTLRHLATLELPGQAILRGLSLSPDGTRLAAAINWKLIALWDLRRLRQELAALDLDWEMPPYPPAEHTAEPVPALTVEILAAPAGSR